MHAQGATPAAEPWAAECITWPRYVNGVFVLPRKECAIEGNSMLELTQAEQDALRIVVLVCTLQKEVYGASHQMNWKKTGLSRAYYRQARVLSSSMPTRRAAAAYDFLMKNNKYYALFAAQQGRLLDEQLPLNISSYDLFTQTRGIECAMFPHLYPTTDFTDTGILQHYQDSSEDDANRVCSIGYRGRAKFCPVSGRMASKEIYHSFCMRGNWPGNSSMRRCAPRV